MSEASKCLFALAVLSAIYYSIELYVIMNHDEKGAGKVVAECIILCVACVVMAIILQ